MARSIPKLDYFLAALKAGSYKHKDWVLEAFSPVASYNADTQEAPYPYALKVEGGHYTAEDPLTHEALTLLDAKAGTPPFAFLEKVTVKPGAIENVHQALETCYGSILVNQTVLVYAFGNKVPYQTGTLKVSGLEKLIEPRLTTTPEDGRPRRGDRLYMDEYKRFNEGIRYLEGFASICVPSATPKTITVSKEVLKRRDELVKQYGEQLEDPVVLAKVTKELTDMDRAWMKGDPAERFYIKDKSFDVVRKRLFIMQGQESGFGKTGKTITSSLSEGWNVENIPAMANSQRNGSYSRGFLTALGGVEAKGNYRIFQNTVVAEEDCGSKLGLRLKLTKDIARHFISHSVIHADGKLTELTEENLSKYIDTEVSIRSVAFCKTKGQNVCATCIGKNIAKTPNAISTYSASLGSTFVLWLLAAAHGSALKTRNIRYLSNLE